MHLSEGKHTSEERVAGIISFRLIAQHRHTMIDTHRQVGILFLEDASQFNNIRATT